MSNIDNVIKSIEAGLIEDDASAHRVNMNPADRKPRFSGNGIPKTVREFTDADRDKWGAIVTPDKMSD